MPTGNSSSTPADWGVTNPPPPSSPAPLIIGGALLELAGATCLLLEGGERGAMEYVCYAAVLIGAAMVFIGLRLATERGLCSVSVGERYHIAANTIDPCPHTWGVGSVVTFYEDDGKKTGTVLVSSAPIANADSTVMLLPPNPDALKGAFDESWSVQILPP